MRAQAYTAQADAVDLDVQRLSLEADLIANGSQGSKRSIITLSPRSEAFDDQVPGQPGTSGTQQGDGSVGISESAIVAHGVVESAAELERVETAVSRACAVPLPSPESGEEMETDAHPQVNIVQTHVTQNILNIQSHEQVMNVELAAHMHEVRQDVEHGGTTRVPGSCRRNAAAGHTHRTFP